MRWCQETYGTDFETIFAEKRQCGKMSLRRSQWRLAEKNPTMSIWLGKQYLDQKEPEQEIKHSGEINNSFIEALQKSSKEIWTEENKQDGENTDTTEQ